MGKRTVSTLEHRVNIRLGELDMRRADLARKMRMSPQCLGVTIRRRGPRLTTVQKLAHALGVTVGWLLGEQQPVEPRRTPEGRA